MHALYYHINYNLTGTSPNAQHLPDRTPTFFRTKTRILGGLENLLVTQTSTQVPQKNRREFADLGCESATDFFSHPQTVWREAIFWTQKFSFSPADHVRLHSDHPYLLWLQIFYIAKTDGRVQRRWQIMRLRLICHAPQFHNSYECSSQKNKKHFKYFQTTSRPPYCHKT